MEGKSCGFPGQHRRAGASEADRYGSDARLIAHVLAGEPGAQAEFIERYRRFVHSLLRRYRISEQDREDVYQDVCVRLWMHDLRALRQWQAKSLSGFGAYLASIVRHLACDHLSRRPSLEILARAPLEDVGAQEEGTAHKSGGRGDFDALLLQKERAVAVRQAIRRIGARDAELIQRRYYMEQSYEEISQAMGFSVDNVGVSLTRARRRLRATLVALKPALFKEDAARPRARRGAARRSGVL